jgi:hypothetical protein
LHSLGERRRELSNNVLIEGGTAMPRHRRVLKSALLLGAVWLAATLPLMCPAQAAAADSAVEATEAALADVETQLTAGPLLSGAAGAVQSLNPDVSVILDPFYHSDNSDEGIGRIWEEIDGFDYGGGEVDNGFNLGEVELVFSANVDPYFYAYAVLAFEEEGAEVEEGTLQTTSLPGGFQVKAGKFFSGFGRINPQHSHQWDFVDRPLVYRLTLGDEGLNDKGIQVTWLAPTAFQLLLGLEAFQGDNELAFNSIGEDPLPDHDGPRLWVGWLKLAPNLPGNHALQVGLFGATGDHQEAHDENEDGADDQWLDGETRFYGADAVYKYDSPKAHGVGDLIVQAEYFRRTKDLELVADDSFPALVGRHREDEQDGLYAQAVYGFAPRWRGGIRYELVGLTNEAKMPDGQVVTYDETDRISAMVDFNPSEFSRLRLQVDRGDYSIDGDTEGVWEVYFQVVLSLGTHGAHTF